MKRLFLLLCLVVSPAFGAGKDYVPGHLLLSNADLSVSTVSSDPVDVRQWDNVDFELIATGSPTGTIFVDCTLNPQVPPATTAPTWIPLGFSVALTGSTVNTIVELNQTGCSYLRLRWVKTSGTGNLTAYVSEKQV